MKRIIDQIQLFLLCVTVFMIPIHIKITSVSIALLVLLIFFDKSNIQVFKKIYKDKKFLILTAPYLIMILGLLNSGNISQGFTQLEISASLLVLPIIFKSYQNNSISKKAEYILSFLVVGVIFAYLICMSVAIPRYFDEGETFVFFYKSFSSVIKGPHHLSYYVVFAIIIIINNLLGLSPFLLEKRKLVGIKVVLLIISIIFLFQLAAKSTIIIFIISMVLFFAYSLWKKLIPLRIVIPSMLIIIMIMGYFISRPLVRIRFDNLLTAIENKSEPDYLSMESTNLRIAAMEASLGIIKDNYIWGVGTGDLFWEMSNYYKENYCQGAYIEHISPHNQFLRSYVMNGIFGFLSLILLFAMMVYVAIKERNMLILQWVITMFILFNVEDILGIQDGIIYFCFFTSYFIMFPSETIIKKGE